MSERREPNPEFLTEAQLLRINRLCNEFEASWRSGRPLALEQVVVLLSPVERQTALRDLISLEIEYRQSAGETVRSADYSERFPDVDGEWLAGLIRVNSVAGNQVIDVTVNDAPPTADQLHLKTMPVAGREGAGSYSVSGVPEKLGDYQIIGVIGSGGMGTVYKALHVRMGRVVALKVLRPELQQNSMLLQRFDREVRAAARLTHPHIVAALDAREQDGIHFLVTEFIAGLDLEMTVRSQGKLQVETAVDCILQAARGLDYAHQQGVVHRDIKPGNLLRDERGVVKILDMGLASLRDDTGHLASTLTNSGMFLGTAAYMAPEQARDVRNADARSDIYSLGCTLYYLLTGRQAFVGATALDTIMSHLSQPIPALTSGDLRFSPALERVFARMVAKDPNDRYQTAAELMTELEGLVPRPESRHDAIRERNTDSSDVGSRQAASRGKSASSEPRANRSAAASRIRFAGFVGLILLGVVMTWLVVNQRTGSKPIDGGSMALSFNGNSSYVVVPDFHPVAGETYTLEAIVQPVGNRLGNVISWLGPDWMAIYHNQGNWGLARRVQEESHVIQFEQPVTSQQPVHLAGIFRGGELQLFVNGTSGPTQPVTFALPETEGGLYIGGVLPSRLPADQNDRFFDGKIHAVRVSRGVRYSSPFQPPTTLKSDSRTLALYSFNSGSGDTVADESGHGHVAHIRAATWTQNSD